MLLGFENFCDFVLSSILFQEGCEFYCIYLYIFFGESVAKLYKLGFDFIYILL